MSRIIRNNDISDELALSQDITFDQELRDQIREKAAKTIQRWYKGIVEKRMIEEAERAIQETKTLMQRKREKLVMNYVEGRESVDVGAKFNWNQES